MKTVVFLGIFLVFLSFIAFAQEEEFSAQTSYDWLSAQATSTGSFNEDVSDTAISILALETSGYSTSNAKSWLLNQLSSDGCFPVGACTIEDTAMAVVALKALEEDSNFETIEAWFTQSALDNENTGGHWYIDVISSANGTCIVSYEINGEAKDINIAVNQGNFPACSNAPFLDLDSCLQSNLITTYPGLSIDVDCSDLEGDVVLTQFYKSSENTFYLLGNENTAQTSFTINNGCFGRSAGTGCDIDASLYAGWALSILESQTNTLVYDKEKADDSDSTHLALFALITKDSQYLADLADIQRTDGSFDRDPFATGLAVLALRDSSEYSENVDNAKQYLREEQRSDGSWNGDVKTTAMVLYGAFPGEATGSEFEVGSMAECSTDNDCVSLNGEGYVCSSGECVIESTGGCNTDDDCGSSEVCVGDQCVYSQCNYDDQCDYPTYAENAYQCASDCYCGDTVCDDVESDSTSSYYCANDCVPQQVTTPATSTQTDTTTVSPPESESSGFGTVFIILLFLILIGGGLFFAYKKGWLKFKKKGPEPPQYSTSQPSYKPFTSRLPPNQKIQ